MARQLRDKEGVVVAVVFVVFLGKRAGSLLRLGGDLDLDVLHNAVEGLVAVVAAAIRG